MAHSPDLVTIGGDIAATHALWDQIIEGTARDIFGGVEHANNDEEG